MPTHKSSDYKLSAVKNYNPGMIKPNANEQVEMKSFQQIYGYSSTNEVENKCYW